MRKFIFLSAALAFVSSDAFAITKNELDSEIKTALQKCYADVKGCKNVTETAAGFLIFPEVTKGGVGVGYETGKGVLIEKGVYTSYYETNSASLGATVGVGEKSMVVAFKTPEELAKFKKSSGWEVGADAAVAMLDAGASANVTSKTMNEPVVGIVFGESGIIADASVKGTKISPVETKDLG